MFVKQHGKMGAIATVELIGRVTASPLQGLSATANCCRFMIFPSPNHRGRELNATESTFLHQKSQLKADLGETFPPLIWGDQGGRPNRAQIRFSIGQALQHAPQFALPPELSGGPRGVIAQSGGFVQRQGGQSRNKYKARDDL